MTCIAELDDYSDFFLLLFFLFCNFPSVRVVPERVCMRGLHQNSISFWSFMFSTDGVRVDLLGLNE